MSLTPQDEVDIRKNYEQFQTIRDAARNNRSSEELDLVRKDIRSFLDSIQKVASGSEFKIIRSAFELLPNKKWN